MKASRYNHFFPYEADDSKLIAYNAFSNALALIDRDKYEMFMGFVEGGTAIEDEELVGQLKAGCFLIDDDCNELDLLRFRMLKSRYSTRSLGLTITPTADCNFRCQYCYEKDVIKPDYMTPEIEEAIIKLAESHMNTIASLHVSWYGGEPLMAFDVIERLSRKLIALCEENNVKYSASMVTNGYLLTKDIAQLLTELQINHVQITLDGSEEVHNQRRPHADGTGTFNSIINNLVECKDVMPPISLRINIDKNNADAGGDVTNHLAAKGLRDKVRPYLGMVTAEKYEKSSCFNSCDFSKEEFAFFNDFSNADTLMSRYPIATRNYCGADSLNSYVIGADGRLYRCWHEVGNHSRCVGGLVGAVNANENVNLGYLLNDPTTDSTCSECNLLPVCMGGCPYKREACEGDVCSIYKFALNDFMGVIAQKLKLQKSKAEVSNKANH